MLEPLVAKSWLRATLAADATLVALVGGAGAPRIYDGPAPEGSAFPYVVFLPYTRGRDLSVIGEIRVWSELPYIVKAVHQAESYADPLQTLAERIDALLHRSRGMVAGGEVIACVRTSPLEYPELKHSVQYRHLGGIYKLQVQSN
jgi:hypothetical protein